MKKIILSFIFGAAISLFNTNAQESPLTICDFESALTAGPVLIGGTTQTGEVVSNPAPDEVNSSANVLKTTAYAIGGDPTGTQNDAVMFQLPTGVTFRAVDYAAIKVNIYVEGGVSSILKPRIKIGVWKDDATSPTPGVWGGIVINRADGESGLAVGESGWMECYFDITNRDKTADYDAIQMQIDWQANRTEDIVMYFDDFVLVDAIPGLTTAISDVKKSEASVYYANGAVKVQSEVEVSEVAVFDISGRKVKQDKGNDIEQVDVSGLKQGVYIVKVKGENLDYTQKVMKK